MALASNALTTAATVEDELGIASGTETARLERLINEASAIAESYAGRTFYRDTAIAEKVMGDEGPYIFVARAPINSITSIEFLGSALSTADYEIHEPNTNGIIYAINGSWARLDINYSDISMTSAKGQQRKAYTVNYDGGWYTPKQEDDAEGTRNLPYDVERAAIMIVSYLRRSLGRDPSITSETLLGASMSYGGAGSSSSSAHWLRSTIPGAAGILNAYRTPILR